MQRLAGFISPRCRRGCRGCRGLVSNPAMHLHAPRRGIALRGCASCLARFWRKGTGVPSRLSPVEQAAGTAKCLLESSRQAPRSAGACTGSKRWVYFCNSVGQIIPLRIPLLVGFPGVYFFSLSSSLRFIRTVFVTDTGTDARMSYQEMSRSFHFGTAVFMYV